MKSVSILCRVCMNVHVQFYLEDNMLNLIDDIENALQHNCLRVALGMALTLPDMCGQVEHPELNVGERYTKWCDKYLKNQGFITTGDSEDKVISGKMCYKLRCAYLHSGNIELNQRKNDDFPEFRLLMCNKDDEGIYCEPIHKDLQGKDLMITVDVRHLTLVLCNAAKEYYEIHEDKTDFKNHHIIIDDVEKIAEKNVKVKQKVKDICSSKKSISDPKELSKNAMSLLKILNEDRGKAVQILFSDNEDEELETMLAIYELIYGGF